MTTNRRLWNVILVLLAAVLPGATAAGPALGAYHIEELFSNADGTLQFVQLADVDRDMLAGMKLTTNDGSATKTYTFPAAPHNPLPARTGYVLIVSQSLAHETSSLPLTVAQWDYVMPDGFIPRNGGSITLEGIERWDFARVPTDGFSALYQSGGIGVHRAHSSLAGIVVRFGFDDFRFVHEFANATSSRHFFTASPGETMALDAGTISGWHQLYGDFVPTFGEYVGFIGFGRDVEVLSQPVCRFYLPPPYDAHFFSAFAGECADVHARYPQFVLEADATFYVGLPDPVTGACAVGLGPVFRLWNPASNDHWFTSDENARDRALAQGYLPEGYGAKGVSWCAMQGCYSC